ncbi:MAG: DNA repair protein RadC [Candidatus Marinimicrobia bacterium]|nr:DNA repair protein RadC [Candidatus Neomarinimicrobiota bacterium]
MEATKTTIKQWPVDDRPREKCIQQGAETLSHAELLAILIRSGTKRSSALDIAKQLLAENDGLLQLGMMTTGALSKYHGVGPAKATTLTAAFQLGARFHEVLQTNETPVITGPESIANAYGERMRLLQKEVCKVILLNRAHRAYRDINISIGSISASIVHPREVFKPAIDHLASAIILMHNHPSGELKASRQDIEITKTIYQAGEILDIPLLDHIIIGHSGYLSLREQGHME